MLFIILLLVVLQLASHWKYTEKDKGLPSTIALYDSLAQDVVKVTLQSNSPIDYNKELKRLNSMGDFKRILLSI